jgi:hypothetical protein
MAMKKIFPVPALVIKAFLSVGIVAQTSFAASPPLSDRCRTQLGIHSGVGGAHGEEALKILIGFCGR